MTTIKISSLSDDFKGVAYIDGFRKIIDSTIPGDEIKIYDNKKIDILNPSLDRISPICPHYYECGGCSLQYIKEDKYLFYKNQILSNIIENLKQNINIIGQSYTVGRYARRRASFKIKDKIIGYYKEKTHQIFDIKECIILDHDIMSIVQNVKKLLINSNFKPIGCDITLADNGIDIVFEFKKELSLEIIDYLVKFAKEEKIIRISSKIDNRLSPIYIKEFPIVKIGNNIVKLPEIYFLQSSKLSQKLLTDLVINKFNNRKNIIDLYCGVGTYSFPLSINSKIYGFDNNVNMIEAANSAKLNNNVIFKLRNLHKNPVTSVELEVFDAAIINPPRSGAKRQISELANSKIKNIAMISCNHVMFKNDAKILIDAGYKINSVNLVDQFYYSKHFEIFAYFQK